MKFYSNFVCFSAGAALALSGCGFKINQVPATSGPVTQLVWSTQPSLSGSAGVALTTQPVVWLEDASGRVSSSAGNSVSLNLYSDSTCETPASPPMNPATANSSQSASSGIATFNGYAINGRGTYYYKALSSGLPATSCSSSPIAVGGPPVHPSGSVPQSAMRLSTINGTAFVDFSAAGTLVPYVGQQIIITDSSGHNLTGYISAAGTGETYGATLIQNTTFCNTTNVGVYNGTLSTSATGGPTNGCYLIYDQTGAGGCWYNNLNQNGGVALGQLIRNSVYTKVGTEAAEIQPLIFINATGTNIGTAGYVEPSSWTQYVVYGTGDSSSAGAFEQLGAGTTTGRTTFWANPTVQQVLTPAATGVTITSTSGGSTYDWATMDSGFNRNDPSGYTYSIPAANLDYSLVWQDNFSSLSLCSANTPGCNWYNPGFYDWAQGGVVSDPTNKYVNLEWASNITSGNFTNISTASSNGIYYHAWTYGYFEVSMAFDPTTGSWPAIWMDPVQTIGQTPAPDGAELDVFEWQSSAPTTFYGTLHVWASGVDQTNDSQNAFSVPAGTNFSDFHAYGVLWTPGSVTWYFDGNQVGTFSTTTSPYSTVFAGQQSMYMILGQLSGCNWTYSTCAGQVSPLNMQVQWVHIYQSP